MCECVKVCERESYYTHTSGLLVRLAKTISSSLSWSRTYKTQSFVSKNKSER